MYVDFGTFIFLDNIKLNLLTKTADFISKKQSLS